MDIYGDLTFDSEKFLMEREHSAIFSFPNDESLSSTDYFALYPQLEHEIYKVVLDMKFQ